MLDFGLRKMIRDGSFDAIFDKHFGKDLAELKLGQKIPSSRGGLPPVDGVDIGMSARKIAGRVRRRMVRMAGGWSVLLAGLAVASAAAAMDVVKPFRAESDLVRYAFHYELLDQVLQRTVGDYGAYSMQPYTAPISSARGHQEAVRGELLNLLISDAGHKIIDEGMIPIPFPLDKGLLGYRVSLIRKENQAKIDQVKTLDDLRALKVGQGGGWGDVKIFEHNRVPIELSSTYEGVFAMLMRGRFDLFPRGATEVVQEMAAYGPQYPDLTIERHLLIKYPYAQFFYVSKSSPHLAKRLADGLEKMRRDGSFDALFNKHFARTLGTLGLPERTVIELENPYLPAWVPVQRKGLWFDARGLR
jgi:hypothetical protein